jgi:hypothetical protein
MGELSVKPNRRPVERAADADADGHERDRDDAEQTPHDAAH